MKIKLKWVSVTHQDITPFSLWSTAVAASCCWEVLLQEGMVHFTTSKAIRHDVKAWAHIGFKRELWPLTFSQIILMQIQEKQSKYFRVWEHKSWLYNVCEQNPVKRKESKLQKILWETHKKYYNNLNNPANRNFTIRIYQSVNKYQEVWILRIQSSETLTLTSPAGCWLSGSCRDVFFINTWQHDRRLRLQETERCDGGEH